MDIKRNIFDSSAKMPATYECCASPVPEPHVNDPTLPGHCKENNNVVHARSPRVGEQK